MIFRNNVDQGTFEEFMDRPETKFGCIAITWEEGIGQQSKVFKLMVFYAKNLKIKTLADQINNLSKLKYLYPHMPKEEAFAPFYIPYSGKFPENECNYCFISDVPENKYERYVITIKKKSVVCYPPICFLFI